MTRMTVGQAMELGLAQQRAGRLKEAEAVFQQVLASEPDHADALHLLGVVNLQSGRTQIGLEWVERAVAVNPSVSDYQCTLGHALTILGRIPEAIAALRRALEIQPDYPEALNNLGNALKSSGDLDAAILEYRKALSLRPDFAEARNNLGVALRICGRTDEAIFELREALKQRPDFPDAFNNLGVAFRRAGRIDEAIVANQQAMALRPNWPAAIHNLALVLLLRGDFQKGFEAYEQRLQVPEFSGSHRPISGVRWDGRPLQGRSLLIHAEQGFGDTIQFVRYLPLVAERADRIILQCQPELIRLFENLHGIDRLVADSDPVPEFDVHSPLLSLPRLFNTTLETIPAKIPYLHADKGLSLSWRTRFEFDDRRIKVGLVWAGRPRQSNNRHRSLPFARLASLMQIQGAQFFSLQKGEAAGQAHGADLTEYSEELKDFADTAALIENLDLIITVDTAVAHLAGAMGKKTWVMLSFAPDWRWMLDRGDSPWYPTMKLFRQRTPGDWSDVIEQITGELSCLVR